jgi:hypothetical protein
MCSVVLPNGTTDGNYGILYRERKSADSRRLLALFLSHRNELACASSYGSSSRNVIIIPESALFCLSSYDIIALVVNDSIDDIKRWNQTLESISWN